MSRRSSKVYPANLDPEFRAHSVLTEHIYRLLKPYIGKFALLAVATIGLSLVGGASQIALTPLLAIVLGRQNVPGETSSPLGFTFDLNQLGQSVLNYLERSTGLTDPWRLLLISSGIYLLLMLINQGAGFLTRYWAMKARLVIARNIENQVFGHIVRLPLSFLHKRQVGWLQARMASDVMNATAMINDLLIDGLSSILLSIFYIALLIRTDFRLSIIAAVAGLVQLGLSQSLTGMARTRTSNQAEITAQAHGFRYERLSSIREIKAFTAEAQEERRLFDWLSKQMEVNLRYFVFKLIEKPARTSVNRAIVVAVMLFGAWQLFNENLTTAGFLLFMFFAQSLIGPLASVASSVLQIVEIRASLEGVAFLLNTSQESTGSRPLPAGGFSKSLTLQNVDFTYDNLPVLQNINLTIERGDMVALVGRSGAGKTTLVDLIMRFYQPNNGHILIDGIPVEEFRLQDYRQLFGVVSQDGLLFNDTVYNNIAYAHDHLPRDDVERAARIANAELFILNELPDGYDTLIGERGVRLSGGQRQRIAIARAVAHRPAILILDEATSSLDSESERLVQDAIAQVVKGYTAIVIAHRLSTILMADKIVVLREGRIVETGTHQELLALDGEYCYLYDLQFAGKSVATAQSIPNLD